MKVVPGQQFITAPMDEFQITATASGTYSVCLQNMQDTETSKDTKIVMLSVHLGAEVALKNAASLKDAKVGCCAASPGFSHISGLVFTSILNYPLLTTGARLPSPRFTSWLWPFPLLFRSLFRTAAMNPW